MSWQLVISCEHASHLIPTAFQALFNDAADVLQSHRGWDIGAFAIYESIHHAFDCPHFQGRWSRLLCDLNRSSHHPNCFSEWIQRLPDTRKREIIAEFHQPYRNQVQACIENLLTADERIIHISVHSFTPVLNGHIRNADIGLLYDPTRSAEYTFARQWQQAIKQKAADLRVRLNYPYQGKSDGICTFFRKQIANERYIGIELEMNQQLTGDVLQNKRLQELCIHTLKTSLASVQQ